MNGKRARLIRRYARAANKDANSIKTAWNGLPRTLPNGTKSGGEPEEAKRSFGAAMRAAATTADED